MSSRSPQRRFLLGEEALEWEGGGQDPFTAVLHCVASKLKCVNEDEDKDDINSKRIRAALW